MRTEKVFLVKKYGADGCYGPDDNYVIAECSSLAEAREAVRRELGVKRLQPSRRWRPEEGIEAYHDFPKSHPDAYGCGGVTIVEEGK